MDCSRARTKDPVEWIDTCPEFSWQIAAQLREWILDWEPDLTESIKWNMLCFSGHKMICGISACQRHLSVTFFRAGELADPKGLFNQRGREEQIMSVRLTSLEELNGKELRRLLRDAVELDGEPALPAPKTKRPPPEVPGFLSAALKTNRRAADGFKKMAVTYQREYLSWLSNAKRPDTRDRRLKEAMAAFVLGLKWVDRKNGIQSR